MAKTQKISRWTWEDLTGQEELRDDNMENFRVTLLWVLAQPPLSTARMNIFRTLLQPEFDDEEGMSLEARAAVYRLSEQIGESSRPFINVCFYSLQEWRLLFEAQFRDTLSIPLFLGEMPEL